MFFAWKTKLFKYFAILDQNWYQIHMFVHKAWLPICISKEEGKYFQNLVKFYFLNEANLAFILQLKLNLLFQERKPWKISLRFLNANFFHYQSKPFKNAIILNEKVLKLFLFMTFLETRSCLYICKNDQNQLKCPDIFIRRVPIISVPYLSTLGRGEWKIGKLFHIRLRNSK